MNPLPPMLQALALGLALHAPPALREAAVPAPAPATARAVIPLAGNIDRHWHSGLSFDAGGTRVHVSGGRATNGRSYVLLLPEGEPPLFIDGRPLLRSSVGVTVAGIRYRVSVDKSFTNPRGGSRLHVEVEGPRRRTVFKPLARDIAFGAVAALPEILVGGIPTRVSLSRGVDWSEGGGFILTDKVNLSLLRIKGDDVEAWGVTPLDELALGPRDALVGTALVRLSLSGSSVTIEDARTSL